MLKRISIFLLILTISVTASSCTHDIAGEDYEFTEICDLRSKSIPHTEYGALIYDRTITESFYEEYPFIDGYYGYSRYEYYYFRPSNVSLLGFNIEIPVFGMTADERLLVYFQYDDETYQKAKEYLMENMDLSEYPKEEYNGYVFYDGFGSDKQPHNFGNFVYNDSNNTIILLALHYFGENYSLYNEDYEWYEYIEMIYGGWYDFSETTSPEPL